MQLEGRRVICRVCESDMMEDIMVAIDISNEEQTIRTVCGYCHASCGLLLHVKNGRIMRVEGDPEHPVNRNYLCVKGRAIPEIVHSEQRLTHPLIRDGGELHEATWDEALELVSTKFLEIREKHGPESLVWSGGAVVNEETLERFVQLTAALGSPNIAGNGHLCSISRRMALEAVYGSPRAEPDYDNANLIIMWGANPLDSHRPGEGSAYPQSHQVLARARRRGAKIVAIDPFRTPTVQLAHEWIRVNPGTDLALMLAMIHVIINEGLYDEEFVSTWVEGFGALREHVEENTPEWASKITGLPSDQIANLAREYATTRPAAIRDGNGLDMHTDVVAATQALGILTVITGNLDIKGGNVVLPPVPLSPVPSVKSSIPSISAETYPLFPNANFPAIIDALRTGEPYRPKAMIVFHANPVLINGDEAHVREALGNLEFLVVSDIFHTATTELADVVLPDVSDYERDGFKTQVTPEGWIIALRQKAVEPPGEARSALDVELDLAKRMGVIDAFPWSNHQEWIDYRLKQLDITYDQLKEQSPLFIEKPPQYRKYAKQGFKTPSGKVEMESRALQAINANPLPTYVAPSERMSTSADFPLVLGTRKSHEYVHTKFRNVQSLNKVHPKPLVWVHPQDALGRGIDSGDQVVVQSASGDFNGEAHVTEDVPIGAIQIDYGWGNPGDGSQNVNRLSTDDDRDPVSGAMPSRSIPVEIAKTQPEPAVV